MFQVTELFVCLTLCTCLFVFIGSSAFPRVICSNEVQGGCWASCRISSRNTPYPWHSCQISGTYVYVLSVVDLNTFKGVAVCASLIWSSDLMLITVMFVWTLDLLFTPVSWFLLNRIWKFVICLKYLCNHLT